MERPAFIPSQHLEVVVRNQAGGPIMRPVELSIRDADFPHRFAWVRSQLEGRTLRWISFGMPRLNPRFKHSVFFLYARHPQSGKIVGPRGTGFLVGSESESDPYTTDHVYAITCQHVAVTGGASIIRINTNDGNHRYIEPEPDDWQFIGGGDDLCAADITERFKEGDVASVIPERLLMRRDFISHEQVEIGEDGFMLGLFADHAGKKQNLVAARFGNLSLLARDDEPIEQPNQNRRPSHIFDLRSRPGFSGSPVFLYRTPAGDLRTAAERGRDKLFKEQPLRGAQRPGMLGDALFEQMEIQENTFLVLLGVHTGQYPEKIVAQKIKKTIGHVEDGTIRDGDKLKVPSSMTIVVPAWEIVNLLNQPFFLDLRHRRNEMKQKSREQQNIPEPEATIEPAVDMPASNDADANPDHLEDFRRLVDVAARKRPRGG
jgi:hypothetical protein